MIKKLKNMKKLWFLLVLLILTILLMLFSSCVTPVLEKKDYATIDTLNVSRNGFSMILGYDVIVQLKDSSLHFGFVTPSGALTYVNIKPIEKLKIK